MLLEAIGVQKETNWNTTGAAFLWIFAGMLLGSLLVNIVLGDTILQNAASYNLHELYCTDSRVNGYELFVFLFLKRGGWFLLLLAGMILLPRRVVLPVLSFGVGTLAGMVIASQVICRGMLGMYEVLLLAFPHIYIYLAGMYLGIKKYLAENYTAMLLFFLLSYILGVLLESFLSPVIVGMLY